MDTLRKFVVDYLNTSAVADAVDLKTEDFEQDFFGVEGYCRKVQYRKPPFQVEILRPTPNMIIPEHTHPNIDSFEVHLGGDNEFSHHGEWVARDFDYSRIRDERYYKRIDECFYIRGMLCIEVKHTDVHGGCFGENGGLFMSIQHWLNGVEPTCVGYDYEGYNIDEVDDNNLDWKCAASKEDIPPQYKRGLIPPFDYEMFRNSPSPKDYFKW
jgi:hypothetical protein|tara:strand:- start:440 stop:1075 length:636 start_codon:yes stop_codon:yes gene_type:complete